MTIPKVFISYSHDSNEHKALPRGRTGRRHPRLARALERKPQSWKTYFTLRVGIEAVTYAGQSYLPWVNTVFGNTMDYQSSLLGYYIALNTLEFLEFLAAGRLVPDDPAQLHWDIVPVFESMPDEIKRRAYRAFVAAGQDLKTIAAQLKLDADLIRRQWPKWVNVQKHSLHLLYPFARAELAQEQNLRHR